MGNRHGTGRRWLTAIVLAHLVVTIVHGGAHAGAHVPLSRAAGLFVYSVILAGPPAGLALTWSSARLGGSIVGATMAGALVFGVVNHFIVAGPDHVAHVAAEWRTLFTTTAVLLAATEASGVAAAVAMLRDTTRQS